MFHYPLHGFCNVTEAANSAWIANLARTTARRNMLTHAFDGVRIAGLLDLGADSRFVLVEAVTNYSRSRRFFLPDGNSKVIFCKEMPTAIEVNDCAPGVRTESIRACLETTECGHR